MVKLIILFLFIGCNVENNNVSINASSNKGQNSNTTSDTNTASDTNTTDQENNNEQNTSNSYLTFTPQGASGGDVIDIGTNIYKLVTVTNSGSSLVTGQLQPSGTNAGSIELISVSNLTQSGSSVNYNLLAGESAKFLVVKKDSFTSSLSATITDSVSSSEVANVTSSPLGYELIFWFNPSDMELSHVNDLDNSNDLSDGDTINTLVDRSGNNFDLTAADSISKGTYIKSGQNGLPNIQTYATISTGTKYQRNITSPNFGITSGEDLLIMMSAKLNNTSVRQSVIVWSSPYSSFSMHGFDFNTYQTSGNKFGVYASNNSYDVTTIDSNNHVHALHFKNTTAGNTVSTNTTYKLDNQLYALSCAGCNGSNVYFSEFSTGDQIWLRMTANIQEIIIAKNGVSDVERESLRCYIALKNNVNSSDCL